VRAGSLGLLLVGYVLLAGDVFANYGLYHPATVLGALLAAAFVVAGAPERPRRALPRWALPGAVALLCAIQVTRAAGWYVLPWADGTVRAAGLAGAVIAIAGAAAGERRERVSFALLVALAIAVRLVAVLGSPSPRIDVWSILQRSAEGLADGENPYVLFFPGVSSEPGAPSEVNPYLPLVNLLALPGYLLAGDVRASMLVADLAAAALLYGLGRARGAAPRDLRWTVLLWAFFPRTPLVLEVAWTEPLVLMLLLGFLYLQEIGKTLTAAVALGLFAASKQYAVLILPLVLLVRRDFKGLALAALVAAAVTLPLALWDFAAFWEDTFRFHWSSPFREDGLTLNALLWDLWGVRLPDWVALTAAGIALPLALWRARGAEGFLHRGACVLLAFLLLSKHAFCNYYYLVCGMLAALVCYGVGEGDRRSS
jgi:hypothetical protein